MITINNISEELTKLKPIDNEDIQKLKEQINAIQKELYKTHQVLQIEKGLEKKENTRAVHLSPGGADISQKKKQRMLLNSQ